MIKLTNKSFLGLKRTENFSNIRLIFRTNQGALFFDKDLQETLKGDGFDGEFIVSTSSILSLYLDLKTFEDTFEGNQHAVNFTEDDKKISFYTTERRPATLHVKGIDYKRKTAGIIYVDTTGYNFVLLLSYMREFFSKFPVLSFSRYQIDISYSKEENLLLVVDKNLETTEYIGEENIVILKELYEYYLIRGGMFTHSFTPSQNIYIDRELNFFINDKKFDLELFKRIYHLISI